jgi:hypothetical protein
VKDNSSEQLSRLGDFTSLGQLEEFKRQMYEHNRTVKQTATPPEKIEMKGGFPFATWDYMLDEMDKSHPLRQETFVSSPELLKEPMVFITSVMVRDIVTGESRIGVDAHPIPAYDAGSEQMKSMKTVRELIGNAAKASVTKALRHAYSNFGISADLYGSMVDEPLSQEQIKIWEEWDVLMRGYLESHPHPQLEGYWNENAKRWKEQTLQSAPAFLKAIEPVINRLIETMKKDESTKQEN